MDDERLQRIVYASRATGSPSDDELGALLAGARARNAAAGLTGMLLFAYGSFLQLLEGPSASLAPVWASIRADERHHDIRVLGDRTVPARRFATWSMGFRSPDHAQLAARLEGYEISQRQPLMNFTLVRDDETAEILLERFAEPL